MPEQSASRVGTKVEIVSLQKSNDARHDHRGVPIMVDVDGKSIIPKEVHYDKVVCDDCGTVLEYDEHADAVCPECGLVAGYTEHDVWSDFNSAEQRF